MCVNCISMFVEIKKLDYDTDVELGVINVHFREEIAHIDHYRHSDFRLSTPTHNIVKNPPPPPPPRQLYASSNIQSNW